MRFGRSVAIAVAASAAAVLFLYPVMVAGGGIHEGTEVKLILISWDCGRLRVEAAGRLLDENKPVPTEEEAPYATLSYVIDMDRRTMSDGRTEESFSPQEAGIIRPFLNIAERYFGDVLGEPPHELRVVSGCRAGRQGYNKGRRGPHQFPSLNDDQGESVTARAHHRVRQPHGVDRHKRSASLLHGIG